MYVDAKASYLIPEVSYLQGKLVPLMAITTHTLCKKRRRKTPKKVVFKKANLSSNTPMT